LTFYKTAAEPFLFFARIREMKGEIRMRGIFRSRRKQERFPDFARCSSAGGGMILTATICGCGEVNIKNLADDQMMGERVSNYCSACKKETIQTVSLNLDPKTIINDHAAFSKAHPAG